MVKHRNSLPTVQSEEGGTNARGSEDDSAQQSLRSPVQGIDQDSEGEGKELGNLSIAQQAARSLFSVTPEELGAAALRAAKRETPLQEVISEGEKVFFFAFTKHKENKEQPQTWYICQGEVKVSPSQYTRAPHKVVVSKVAISRLHGNKGDQKDALSLIGKEIHLPSSSLHRELNAFTMPREWWSNK